MITEYEYDGCKLKIPSPRRGGAAPDPTSLNGLIHFCKDNVDPQDLVLELGCFFGASTAVFSQFAKKVISVDINFGYLEEGFTDTFNNVDLIQDSSLNAHNHKIEYDLLYVDTVHEYDHCISELKSLFDLCKSSPKKIGGHDYGFEGIRKAVKDFFGKEPDQIYSDSSWIYKV